MILKWEKLYVKNMKCESSMDRKMSVPSWARLEKRLGEVCAADKGHDYKGFGLRFCIKVVKLGLWAEKICMLAVLFASPTSRLQPGQINHSVSNMCFVLPSLTHAIPTSLFLGFCKNWLGSS